MGIGIEAYAAFLKITTQLKSADLLCLKGVNLRHLSMGMSADLELAIQEVSTMLRIGTDVFGKRNLPPGTYWPEKEWAHLT